MRFYSDDPVRDYDAYIEYAEEQTKKSLKQEIKELNDKLEWDDLTDEEIEKIQDKINELEEEYDNI